VRAKRTKKQLEAVAKTPPLRMALDHGASYHRWYRARRALGLPTGRKRMPPEQAAKRKRNYMRLYMRAWRRNQGKA
jgi:hypothetical protein